MGHGLMGSFVVIVVKMEKRSDLRERLLALNESKAVVCGSLEERLLALKNDEKKCVGGRGLFVSQQDGKVYERALQLAQEAMRKEKAGQGETAIRQYFEAGNLLIQTGRVEADPVVKQMLRKKAFQLLCRAENLDRFLTTDHTTSNQQQINHLQTQNRQLHRTLSKLPHTYTTEDIPYSEQEEPQDHLQFNTEAFETKPQEGNGGSEPSSHEQDIDAEAQDLLNTELDVPIVETKPQEGKVESDRDYRRRALVNELHSYIGLPEVTEFRKFKPLPDTWKSTAVLEQEKELERLRKETLTYKNRLAKALESSVALQNQNSQEINAIRSKLKEEEQENHDRLQELLISKAEMEKLHKELEEEKMRHSLNSSKSDGSHHRPFLEKLNIFKKRDKRDNLGGDSRAAPRSSYTDRTVSSPTSYDESIPRRRNSEADACSPRHVMLKEEEGDDSGVWV